MVAGAMFGNVPRFAMQLSAAARLKGSSIHEYISLDGYEWCIDSRCVRRLDVPNAELPHGQKDPMCGGDTRGCYSQPAARYWDKQFRLNQSIARWT
jgi:hypothetical protein